MKSEEIKSIYPVPFTVRSYEVNEKEKTSLSSVCNYFQEAAGIHAHHLNFDITQLRENGHTWVLYKMHVKVDEMPVRWQNVIVKTWPSSGDGIRAFRDYELLDENENRLASAVSQWMVLDIKTKKPVRMPRKIMEFGLKSHPHVIEPDKNPVPGADPKKAGLITVVGNHDLDMNSHVNNVRYIDWMTGCIPGSVTGNRVCKEIEIQYAAEAVKGDSVYHSFEEIGNDGTLGIRHSLFRGDDKNPIATAITTWL